MYRSRQIKIRHKMHDCVAWHCNSSVKNSGLTRLKTILILVIATLLYFSVCDKCFFQFFCPSFITGQCSSNILFYSTEFICTKCNT